MSTSVVDGQVRHVPVQVISEFRPRLAVTEEQALSAPSFPLPEPKRGKLARQAAGLLALWQKRADYANKIKAELAQREVAARGLEEELHAERARAAEQGDATSNRDRDLYDEIMSFGAIRRDVYLPRLAEAVRVAQDAANQYHAFLDNHGVQLVRELEPQAQEAHRLLQAELAKFRERIAKVEGERNVIAAAARSFISGVHPFLPLDVPEDSSEPPLPSQSAWRRYYSAHPEAE